MVTTLLPFSLALIASLVAVPAIIKVAYHKRLVDDPRLEERKIHRYSVPNLGGVAVFSIFALVSCLFTSSTSLQNGNFIFAAGIIIFCIGLKDDLVSLDPYKKFLAQFVTAFITVYLADIRITSFYGVLGIYELTPILSYLFSSITIVFIINAFNLIDGINGLLGGLTLLISLSYGTLFYFMDQPGLSVMAFSLAGSVLGFLKFNAGRKARIFMGDAGAYSIGFVIALLSIKFIELNKSSFALSDGTHFIRSAPAIALAILVIPTFDTIRVFTKRIINGKSPFFADRNHIHHRLLNVGFSHSQASLILVGTNIGFIALALGLDQIGTPQLTLIVILTAQFISAMFWLYDAKRRLIETNRIKNVLLPEEDVNINAMEKGTVKTLVPKEITEELLERLEDQKS